MFTFSNLIDLTLQELLSYHIRCEFWYDATSLNRYP